MRDYVVIEYERVDVTGWDDEGVKHFAPGLPAHAHVQTAKDENDAIREVATGPGFFAAMELPALDIQEATLAVEPRVMESR